MLYPHPCGEKLERIVASEEAHPLAVVPNEYFVVRGGTKPLPVEGATFSCVVGPTLEAAGCAVQHGQFRWATAGAIRSSGGTICWFPEFTPRGILNKQHVNVTEGIDSAFSEMMPNPVPKADRIDGGR